MKILRRLRYWLNRADREQSLQAEIEAHIEEAAAELREAGRPEPEARAEARRRFGRSAPVHEASGEVWIARLWQETARDAAYAVRGLRRQPGFAAAAMVSAGLGIAACVTVFGMVNYALFRPLPVSDAGSLMAISAVSLKTGVAGTSLSAGELGDLRGERAFAAVAAFAPFLPAGIAASLSGEAQRHWGQLVSANYFDVVRPEFVLGHGFTHGEDDVPGAPAKVVLSHALWRLRFNADRAIVGRVIHVNKRAMTVTGVTGAGFRGTEPLIVADFFVPFSQVALLRGSDSSRLQGYDSQWLAALGRRAPGVDRQQAQAALTVLAANTRARVASLARDRSLYTEPAGMLMQGVRRGALPAFLLLLTVAFLVLLTACANVANLMLARASARRQEIATRLSVGAGRARLVRQLLTESLLLAFGGGAMGLALAAAAANHIAGFELPMPVPLDLEMRFDTKVALFAVALSALTALAFGLVPALRASRPDLVSALKLDRPFGLRNGLVVAQVAISAVLVICSGLFLRSLGAAQQVTLGMDPSRLLLVRFDPSISGYDAQAANSLVLDVIARAESTPGVRLASAVNLLPLSIGGNFTRIQMHGQEGSQDGTRSAEMAVTPRYFETMGIALREGRDFQPNESAPVAIVNEELARLLFPGASAVGRTLVQPAVRIVGVAANAKYRLIQEQETTPVLYMPLTGEVALRDSFGGLTLLVKTHGPDPGSLAAPIRQAILSRDPGLVVNDAGTMERHVTEALILPRLAASLFGLCGAIGLAIAAVGIYGVMSFAVARRSREIGIRLALGAAPAQVVRGVLTHALVLSTVGIALGVGAGVGLAYAARALLLGVTPADPWTLGVVPGVLLSVALAAAAIPARRAAAIEPNRILRAE